MSTSAHIRVHQSTTFGRRRVCPRSAVSHSIGGRPSQGREHVHVTTPQRSPTGDTWGGPADPRLPPTEIPQIRTDRRQEVEGGGRWSAGRGSKELLWSLGLRILLHNLRFGARQKGLAP